MRVAVFGTGAVGGYFGGRLAQAGEWVTFIARGRTLDALRVSGLRVRSIAGDFEVRPAEATDRPAEVGVVDLVLVAVKAWQVPEVAAEAHPLLGANTSVLPLVNGVEAYDQLASQLGAGHVLGGLCRVLAYRLEPGLIQHAGIEPALALGEWDGRPTLRVARIKEAFDRCIGVKAHVPPSIRSAVWEKFLFIAPFSGVGAVARAPAGALRTLLPTRALIEGMMREVLALALALGVPMRDDIVDKTMSGVDALPADGTASMQRDMMDGRPSELEAQVGAVVRLAKSVGLPVPLHAVVYACLLPAEQKARGALAY